MTMLGQFSGGFVKTSLAEGLKRAQCTASHSWWETTVGDRRMFLRMSGGHSALSKSDDLAILIRGQVVGPDGNVKLSELADLVRNRYHNGGELRCADLEGSFSIIAMDAAKARVSIYRNLIDSSNTFYTVSNDGLLFASNLADLLDMMPSAPSPNQEVLPLFFLFRYVPGPRTLFSGVSRLLPGAEAVFETTIRVHQRHTFAEFRKEVTASDDAVEQLDALMGQIARESRARTPQSAILFSGGVDSSYLQAHWNSVAPGRSAPSFCAALDHPMTLQDTEYARSSALSLKTTLTLVPVNGSYASYLTEAIALTGEPPNHVQAAYFPTLARALAEAGISVGICGEAADGVFGFESTRYLQNASLLRWLAPLSALRRAGAAIAVGQKLERVRYYFRLADQLYNSSYFEHPVNTHATFTNWPAVRRCFGDSAIVEALADRLALVHQHFDNGHPLELLQAAGLVSESTDSAAYWNTLFASRGVELHCPFVDSRVLRLVMSLKMRARFPFRRPKALVKRALTRYVPSDVAFRPKRGFGQPIFEWLAPGGQLRALVDNISQYDFVDQQVLEEARARPNWFLYSLLCYDIWHKTFVAKSMPFPSDIVSTCR
jgi:asparagine synthase (glutamine-hydrolysing)